MSRLQTERANCLDDLALLSSRHTNRVEVRSAGARAGKKNTLWADTTVSRSILVAAAAGAGFAMAVSVGG
jgi:anti-sigma-K factor RskA